MAVTIRPRGCNFRIMFVYCAFDLLAACSADRNRISNDDYREIVIRLQMLRVSSIIVISSSNSEHCCVWLFLNFSTDAGCCTAEQCKFCRTLRRVWQIG